MTNNKFVLIPVELLKNILPSVSGTEYEQELKRLLASREAIENNNVTKLPKKAIVKKVIDGLELEVGSIQSSGNKTYLMRLKPIQKEAYSKLYEALNKEYGKVIEIRYEQVGPTLGKELLQKTFIAAILAIAAILLYVAWAFKSIRYGVSAILALLHDVLVVVSVFAILGKWQGVEVDSLFVTAILTTMSFSVHDTIVVFDRIRESQKRSSGAVFGQVVNQALTETMGRSLNNSLTIIFMLLALVLLGGETIRWFAMALLVGTITGTYSSPFVATPFLYTWHQLRDRGKGI
jgi:preprotein translocase subunit SecF